MAAYSLQGNFASSFDGSLQGNFTSSYLGLFV